MSGPLETGESGASENAIPSALRMHENLGRRMLSGPESSRLLDAVRNV